MLFCVDNTHFITCNNGNSGLISIPWSYKNINIKDPSTGGETGRGLGQGRREGDGSQGQGRDLRSAAGGSYWIDGLME